MGPNMGDSSLITTIEALLQLSMIIMVGIYFIFSNSVMRVLSTQHNGADIMIEINRQILNPTFLLCFCLSSFAALYFFAVHSGLRSIAGLVFFTGTTLATVVFNVPLNNKLRDSSRSALSNHWQVYLKKWVFWNHVRTVSAIVYGLLVSLSMYQ